jgi:hypothetical protein
VPGHAGESTDAPRPGRTDGRAVRLARVAARVKV